MQRLKKLFKSRFAIGLVCVLIAVYTLYHLIGLFDSEIATFAAGVTTEHKTLGYDAYVFRNETVLYASDNGLADYAVADGTKVARGQTLATVYGGNSGQQTRLRALDERIALLEESLAGGNTDPTELKESVSDSYDTLVKMLASGDSGGLSEETDRFLHGLNQMDSLWYGEDAPAAKTLASLREQREKLIASCGNGVTYRAERSGYFSSEVDGQEGIFTMEALENLTGDDFYRLISTPAASTAKAYGKISYSSEWRLVVPVAMSERSYFEEGKACEGLFEENGKTTLPLTVEKVIPVPEHGTALVVLSCDRLPEDFSLNRRQSVQITVDSVSGIYVPKTLVKRVEGMRGVYILRGSVVYFRQIDILYEGSDYYLVRENAQSEDVSYLQVNDLIITKGKNLFDGRVVR